LTKDPIVISGRVIRGQKYGRVLGFPTANLDRRDYVRRGFDVKLGVWSGQAKLKIKNYPAAIVIGPLDKNHLPKIEAHLLNFKGNLYGKKITIILRRFVRPFIKFKNEEELKKQIRIDIGKIKKSA
jgi:riboflavin kinase/FMN adenylyltransferase